MLPLINLRKTNNSILGQCHPILKMVIFLSGLIYFFIVPIELKLKCLLPSFLFILIFFVLSNAWVNRKIYGFMLLPFLSFFLVFTSILIIIYFLKYGFGDFYSFYLEKFNQLARMFIKGLFIVSLVYVFIMAINLRELLYAFKKIKIPHLFISQLVLIIRSLQLLVDEFRLLPLALRSRGLGRVKMQKKFRNLLHSIFCRTVKRGQNFEYALHSRRFKGEFFTLYSPAWGRRDSFILFLFTVVLIILIWSKI